MIKRFETNIPGPNLVVMAGVHGNELCGLFAFKEILPSLHITRGTVTFIIGNPKAVAIEKRIYQVNLNRMFRDPITMTDHERTSYEFRRAQKLKPFLAKADALLDIHSSTTEQSEPFIICEPQGYAYASYLPARIVVSGIDALHPTGTDGFVNESGGIGICIECRNHTNATAHQVAMDAIFSFLSYFKMIESIKRERVQKQRHIHADTIYKNSGVFLLAKNFSDFENLSKGDLIGLDDTNEIRAPHDGVIIFPGNKENPGSEAFVFGREVV